MEDRRPELAEQNPLRVVAAILFDGQEILACRRNPDKAAGGLWEFPGGKIEPGETPAAALVREIREPPVEHCRGILSISESARSGDAWEQRVDVVPERFGASKARRQCAE